MAKEGGEEFARGHVPEFDGVVERGGEDATEFVVRVGMDWFEEDEGLDGALVADK